MFLVPENGWFSRIQWFLVCPRIIQQSVYTELVWETLGVVLNQVARYLLKVMFRRLQKWRKHYGARRALINIIHEGGQGGVLSL